MANRLIKIAAAVVVTIAAISLLLDRFAGVREDMSPPPLESLEIAGGGAIDYRDSFDGLTLSYRHWPAKAPLRGAIALFHGGGGHSGQPTFSYFIEYFRQRGFAVFGLDQRGHGYSDGIRYHIESMETLRRDMFDFVDFVRSQPGHDSLPVIGVGQSMGGLFLLDFAIHHPDALEGAVVTAPGLDPHGIPQAVQTATRFGNVVAPRWHFRIPALDYDGLTRDKTEIERVAADTLSKLVGTPRTIVNILDTVERVNQRAGELTTPLHMAHGEVDVFAAVEGTERFFAKVPEGDKELIVYPDAYHQLYLDIIKDEFFANVERWIDRQLGDRFVQSGDDIE